MSKICGRSLNLILMLLGRNIKAKGNLGDILVITDGIDVEEETHLEQL